MQPMTVAVLAFLLALCMTRIGFSQNPPAPPDPNAMAAAALAAEEPNGSSTATASTDGVAVAANEEAPRINILELLERGGYLMWPIAVMSFLVVTFGLERILGLRRVRVVPNMLVRRVHELSHTRGRLRLDMLSQVCDMNPSAAATVLQTMIRKAGRPLSEIEHSIRESCDREATRLYTNVRWLGLAAGVSPLLGLLGTVWGMIQAFFATANLPTGANKADYLADGIYVALVTTFAGLAVAIPAGVLAHMFEGRIQKLFREINELVDDLLPHFELLERHYFPQNGHVDAAEAEVPAPVVRKAVSAGPSPPPIVKPHFPTGGD